MNSRAPLISIPGALATSGGPFGQAWSAERLMYLGVGWRRLALPAVFTGRERQTRCELAKQSH